MLCNGEKQSIFYTIKMFKNLTLIFKMPYNTKITLRTRKINL